MTNKIATRSVPPTLIKKTAWGKTTSYKTAAQIIAGETPAVHNETNKKLRYMRWIWIDKFVEFEPGKRAVAVKNVTMAEEHLHDHFPGYPTMPASLMIEAMAQTGGILVGQARRFQEKVILAKVGKAVFHELVRPGDQLHLEAVIDNIAEEAAVISGTIRCEDQLIAEINLMFSHIDRNLAGMEFPEENFVFNAQFMNLLKCYLPSDTPGNH